MVRAARGARVWRGVKMRDLGEGFEEGGGGFVLEVVVVGGVLRVEGAEVVLECGFVMGWVEGLGGTGPEEDIIVVEGEEEEEEFFDGIVVRFRRWSWIELCIEQLE
jgi:hypothetical protein